MHTKSDSDMCAFSESRMLFTASQHGSDGDKDETYLGGVMSLTEMVYTVAASGVQLQRKFM